MADPPSGPSSSALGTFSSIRWWRAPNLVERDGQTLFARCTRLVTEQGLGLSRQAISRHLVVLESAGLVLLRRQRLYKVHDLNTEPLERIVTR